MRGSDERSGSLFSYVDLEARVRGDHPLRTIREVANAALSELSRTFTALYTDFGRPSIAPEKLLRAMLLQAFYGIRSERQLMERLEFDLSVPLVCRSRRGRSGLGPLDVLQEPRPAAGGGDRREVPDIRAGATEGETVAVERSLLSGRHADRGLGIDQELPEEGWRRR